VAGITRDRNRIWREGEGSGVKRAGLEPKGFPKSQTSQIGRGLLTGRDEGVHILFSGRREGQYEAVMIRSGKKKSEALLGCRGKGWAFPWGAKMDGIKYSWAMQYKKEVKGSLSRGHRQKTNS